MKVVIDTNILVASARSKRGASYRILSLIPDERFQICVSLPLYLEYLDVLNRPKHHSQDFTSTQAVSTVRYLLAHAHLQEIYFSWRPFLPDIKDDMVLELAVASQAKKIITFNVKDFRGAEQFGVEAIKPKDFLLEIGEIS